MKHEERAWIRHLGGEMRTLLEGVSKDEISEMMRGGIKIF